MKKYLAILFLAACVALTAYDASARATKPSVVRDSKWLSSESVMTSNIDQSRGNRPLGSIVAYPNMGNLSAYVTEDWLECDGRAVPTNSDLYKKMGITRTPNLYKGMGANGKGYFLRAGATPGLVSTDTIGSHVHGQPSHTHYTSGGLTSTDVSVDLVDDKVEGEAEAQKSVYRWTWWHNGASNLPFGQQADGPLGNWVPLGMYFGTNWNYGHSHTYQYWGRCYGGTDADGHSWYYDCLKTATTGSGGEHSHIAKAGGGGYLGVQDTPGVTFKSDVAGIVKNTQSRGDVDFRETSGTAHASGGDLTYPTGDEETSTTFITMRYFMRINE